jgi:hypothetical protein
VDKLIESSKQIEEARMDAEAAKHQPEAPKGFYSAHSGDFVLIESLYLKPGIYRLNKPWENDGVAPASGCGLLAKMGLPTVVACELRPVSNTPGY